MARMLLPRPEIKMTILLMARIVPYRGRIRPPPESGARNYTSGFYRRNSARYREKGGKFARDSGETDGVASRDTPAAA